MIPDPQARCREVRRGRGRGRRRRRRRRRRRSGNPGRLPSRGPHGSGPARLTHPALRATDSLRRVPQSSDPRRREGVVLLQPHETLPRPSAPLRSSTQPLAPASTDLFAKPPERLEVPGDPVVLEVPAQLARERLPLLLHGAVSVGPAPLRHSRSPRPKAVQRRRGRRLRNRRLFSRGARRW